VRKFCCQAVAVVVLVLLLAPGAYGQATVQSEADMYDTASKSGGGLLDWIAKLSGPAIWRAGLYGAWRPVDAKWASPSRGIQFRGALYPLTLVNNRGTVTPDDANISVQSAAATAIIPLFSVKRQVIELGFGYNYYIFTAEMPDSAGGEESKVHHYSIPVFLHTPLKRGKIGLDIAAGVQLFPPFKPTDFLPVVVSVDTTGWEPTFYVSLNGRFITLR
jgi:hypothetical protein